jgi:hypothetical protein
MLVGSVGGWGRDRQGRQAGTRCIPCGKYCSKDGDGMTGQDRTGQTIAIRGCYGKFSFVQGMNPKDHGKV